MHASKVVPQKFVDDFEAVATYYRLRELGEYETAKQAARDDLDNAIVCFAKMVEAILT